ncbi:glycosyltransferase [Peribacillus frigoritolerans]|uniref:glycosyltransferase n=1 Tax=Peribacillus frigoritolerans TaxID=450367 RepID=UPI00207A7719|nr:glycosyltransferase [Peribacillus frigoritolerans]USK78063.1 glycosyltransferase [Peribacillus frigoritolerans]WJE45391.1 glycosyltransferase [Peribacillus frigoritolerans]
MRILIWTTEVSIGGGTRLLANLLPAIARQEDIELVRLIISSKTHFKEQNDFTSYSNIEIEYFEGEINSKGTNKYYDDCHVIYYFWPHLTQFIDVKRPTICTFHDSIILDYVPPFSNGKYIRAYWEQSKKWLEKCTMVVVSSQFVKSRLIKNFGNHLASAVVIPHAILPENYSPVQSINTELAARLPKKYFVYPANTSPHKNHYNLLLAYSKFKYRNEYPLVLFGHLTETLRNKPPFWPDTPYLSTLVSLINRLELIIDKDIFPLGFINDIDVSPTIKNSQALVMPSLSEGGGSYPVEEALRLGVPVLCSDIPVMREHIGGRRAKVAWFNPESIDSITNALENMVLNYDEYKKVSIQSMNDPTESWDSIARKYIHVMRQSYQKFYNQ